MSARAKQKKGAATAPPLRRTGLQRLSCPLGCEAFAYLTVAAIERGRLPLCPDCHARMLPDHPELAAKVLGPEEWDAHPWLRLMADRTADAFHGQAPAYRNRLNRAQGSDLRDPSLVAWEGTRDRVGVAEMMRAESRARQLAGLVQNTRAQEARDEIPF